MHHRFSDFSKEEKRLDGTKKRLEDVLNREILITGYTTKSSKYSDKKSSDTEYLTLQFEMDGNKHILFTGSIVLADQIARYKDHIPFYTTIRHIDRYYTFT